MTGPDLGPAPARPPAFQVWHNYGFDRHVLKNMGVSCGGFAADTLHMARLHDASRKLRGGYSLEALSSDKKVRPRAVV
jgi:DNA polymerase-1